MKVGILFVSVFSADSHTCSCDKVTLSDEFTGKIRSSSLLPPFDKNL